MKIGLIAAAIAVCATAASAQTLTAEGEEGVTYTVIALEVGETYKEITTRSESAGTNTYSKHAVSCEPYRAGVLGTGATLDIMNDNLSAEAEMLEIIRASAEDAIADYACAN